MANNETVTSVFSGVGRFVICTVPRSSYITIYARDVFCYLQSPVYVCVCVCVYLCVYMFDAAFAFRLYANYLRNKSNKN